MGHADLPKAVQPGWCWLIRCCERRSGSSSGRTTRTRCRSAGSSSRCLMILGLIGRDNPISADGTADIVEDLVGKDPRLQHGGLAPGCRHLIRQGAPPTSSVDGLNNGAVTDLSVGQDVGA